MLKNHNFIFLIIVIASIITASTLFATKEVSAQTANANQTVAITTTIDPITILTNELMPLLDTSAIGNLTSLTITTNLPCDTSNVPKVKIIAGILSNTTNVIDSSSDYTNNKGPRDTCVFTDKITNVTAKGIPAMNRVFLKNTGSTPVHIPEGVMVTLTGIFGKAIATSPTVSCPGSANFCDDYTTSAGWTTRAGTCVTVDSGTADKVDFASCPSNADHRVSKPLGFTLSDANWTAHFEIKQSAHDNGAQGFAFFVSAGTAKFRDGTQDALGVFVPVGTAIAEIGLVSNNDGSLASTSAAQSIDISTGTTYYVKVERTSSTNLRLSVFTDAAMTAPQSGSPVNWTIPAGITGLTTLQHSSDDGGGAAYVWSGTLDNTKIWKNSNP